MRTSMSFAGVSIYLIIDTWDHIVQYVKFSNKGKNYAV